MTGEIEAMPFCRGWHVADYEGQYYLVSTGINHQFGVGHPNKNAIFAKLVGTGLSGRVTAALLKIETPLARIRVNGTVVVFEFMDNSILVATKLRQVDNELAYLVDPIKIKSGVLKKPEQEEFATLETGCTVDTTVIGAVYLTMLGFSDEGDLVARMKVNSQGLVTLTSENGSAQATFDCKLRNIEPRQSKVVLNWLKPLLAEGDCLHIGSQVITIFKPKGVVLLQLQPVDED
jgi:hypothetical protein